MDTSSTSNAVAGPSTARSPSRPASPARPAENLWPAGLYLPSPGPPANQVLFSSTDDLIGRFSLQGAYDKYVRPLTTPVAGSTSAFDHGTVSDTKSSPVADIKGKGREVLLPQTPAADGQDDDEDGPGSKRGDKKKKNNYRDLIRNIPGKHSMKKDDYLTNIMQIPPKQRVKIAQFDLRTQAEAFTVSAGGIPGYSIKAIVKESPQAREDRKRNREARRAAQAQAIAAANVHTPNAQPAQAHTPLPSAASARAATPNTSRPAAPTPRPAATTRLSQTGVPRLGSTKPPLPPVQVPAAGARVGTPGRTATPTGPHPLSAPPLSASSLADDLPTQLNGGGVTIPPDKRGKKREWEDSTAPGAPNGNAPATPTVNTFSGNTNGAANGLPRSIVSAKAGVPGARPRPVKKQRVDMQGQARELTPVQQPTPQGV